MEQRDISDGIPAIPQNRKSRNSVPNTSTEEKTTRRGTKIEADSRNSVPNHSAEEKTSRNKTRQRQSLTLTVFKLRVLVEAVRNGRDVVECG
jgi:hypothetical protein